MPKSLVTLITGASTGFGRLAAEALAARGHTVFAGMRDADTRNRQNRESLLDRAKTLDWTLDVVELDVTDGTHVDDAVAHVIASAGRIDVLVNNAGIAWMGVTEAFSVEQAKLLFDTNLFGVMRMNRAVLPHMRERGSGLLLHVTSGVGRIVFPFSGLYSSSKWALEGYAECLRYELAPLGIDAVIVEPGAYPTEIVTKIVEPDDPERAEQYGDTARLAGNIGKKFGELFEGEHAPDPQDVVDAMVKLIDTPLGERPLRTPVGRDAEPLIPLNAMSAAIQRRMLQYFELDPLLATTPAPGDE